MSLKDPIKFRLLIDQLTKQEEHQFFLQLLNESKNIIITSLFEHFVKNIGKTQHFNNMISTIIRKRKPNTESQQVQDANNKLDTIPTSLIGYMASFLKQPEYIDLSKVNRSVYLGCNSPNMLQELDLSVDLYDKFRWNLCPSIKSLIFPVPDFEDISIPKITPIFNRLEYLFLGANDEKTMQQFMDNNFINFQNVTKLTCGSVDERISASIFTKWLSQFPKLKHLKLYGSNIEFDINTMSQILSGLTILSLIDMDHAKVRDLVNRFGDK